jgi:DNA-binding response OmpR family regulator
MVRSATKALEEGLFESHFQQPETALSTAHRLLVVDDDEAVLEIIQDMLLSDGYRVVAVADGKKALETIETEEFDLVVTDLGMPGTSGWEIAKKVKGRNPGLPVVLLTGWGVELEEEDLSNEGIDMLLAKPLNWTELTKSIRKLL